MARNMYSVRAVRVSHVKVRIARFRAVRGQVGQDQDQGAEVRVVRVMVRMARGRVLRVRVVRVRVARFREVRGWPGSGC